ncbi:hypothetical protein HYS49_00815 [Candidatus Woesearchaeota archaeon]|nr:hypothetical protein [Candidatus Woesearchaeota archaeon]
MKLLKILSPEISIGIQNAKAYEEIRKFNITLQREVEKAIHAGAARTLLLTDEYVQEQREKGNFAALDELMKLVDQLQGKVHILSAQSESGRKLNGLGGIAALLRYELPRER